MILWLLDRWAANGCRDELINKSTDGEMNGLIYTGRKSAWWKDKTIDHMNDVHILHMMLEYKIMLQQYQSNISHYSHYMKSHPNSKWTSHGYRGSWSDDIMCVNALCSCRHCMFGPQIKCWNWCHICIILGWNVLKYIRYRLNDLEKIHL